MLDLTNSLLKLSLSFLSTRYCWSIIGYSFPSLLNVVTLLPPYKVSNVWPIDLVDIPKSLALFLFITNFTSGLFLLKSDSILDNPLFLLSLLITSFWMSSNSS